MKREGESLDRPEGHVYVIEAVPVPQTPVEYDEKAVKELRKSKPFRT